MPLYQALNIDVLTRSANIYYIWYHVRFIIIDMNIVQS